MSKQGVNIKVEPPDHLRVASPSIHGYSSHSSSLPYQRHKEMLDQNGLLQGGGGPLTKRPRVEGHSDGWQ